MNDAASGSGPIFLSASVSCIDPLIYRETVTALDGAGIDGFHFDFCDGHFAPTLMLSPLLVKALRPLTRRRFDIHLYCTHPSRYLDELAAAGADLIVVQVEAGEDHRKLMRRILELGKQAGLGILPGSRLPADLGNTAAQARLIMTNTVGPAYAGQPFDPRGLENARRARRLLDERSTGCELGIDGGISADRLPDLLSAGASHLVLGTSSLFIPGERPEARLARFRRLVEQAQESSITRTPFSRNSSRKVASRAEEKGSRRAPKG